MNLDVYNTHMELYPYVENDFPVLELMYTATDKFTGLFHPCGYMIEDGKLFLPRGTPISKIERLCDLRANYITESDPAEYMSRRYDSQYDPRDELQEESIKFLLEPNHQAALNLKTGQGKTFCTAFASTRLNLKTLIITPKENLKNQWIMTYNKMFDYRKRNLVNIDGTSLINNIMNGYTRADGDVYFVNHQTLHSYMTSTNGYALHQFFRKLNIGIKVYDESHMMFDNILLIDFYSNTNRTWYLTATFDRSDKTQSKCFKQAFSSVPAYGERESFEAARKHVIYHVVNINSRIDYSNRSKLYKYPGFSASHYAEYAFNNDPNQTLYKTIRNILKKLKNTEGKILIFIPLISIIDDVVKKLKKDFPDYSIAPYHSKLSADEKESAQKKDIIVSTIKSLGTGSDIKGLRSVICAEPIASKVLAEQMFGRLRPYSDDKDTFFFDIVDVCIKELNWWYRARFKKIESLAKKVVYLTIDE